MDKRDIKTLIVGDNELECGKITLTEMNIKSLGFIEKDLKDYDLIVYKGKKGCKILRSRYFPAGKIN